jgi:hypothetical protein
MATTAAMSGFGMGSAHSPAICYRSIPEAPPEFAGHSGDPAAGEPPVGVIGCGP